MRHLAVGSMFPPHHLGGYELIWESAVRSLRARGDEVRVLCSDLRLGGREGAEDPPWAARELRWYWRDHGFPRMSWRRRLELERHDGAVFDRHVEELAPDVVSWWAMGGMPLSLIERARRHGLPAVGFVIDDWMRYGPHVDPWTRAGRRLPAPAASLLAAATGVPVRFAPGDAAEWVFCSEHTLRTALAAGHRLPRTALAHPGIDPAHLDAPRAEREWGWRLACIGRIDPRKGIGRAIEALALLPGAAVLDVTGAGDAAEQARLEALAEALGVAGRVRFLGAAARDELPARYADADALLFPVEWPEPWGLVPLEAMAAGTPVVATGTGGSGEYLRDAVNCLLFAPGDAGALAAAVERLAGDPALRARLRDNGFQAARRFTETAYDARVAAHLDAAVASAVA